MTRALTIVALLFLLSGCIPMPIQQKAGVRGQVIDIDSKKPIPDAQICTADTEKRCVFSEASGMFDLQAIYKDKWLFFMVEPFVFVPGHFTVQAGGYAEKTIEAAYGSRITVELTRSE
jgi:hypothetical protein